MARFKGEIGYGDIQETSPGVFVDVITERTYFGDVNRASRKLSDGEPINDDISLVNTISIVADAFANANFLAIRYIRWAGTLWKVSDVEIQRPRLLLRLGGAYSGPVAS